MSVKSVLSTHHDIDNQKHEDDECDEIVHMIGVPRCDHIPQLPNCLGEQVGGGMETRALNKSKHQDNDIRKH